MGKTKRGKGSKIMVIADGNGLPIALDVGSASPHEVKLVEKTIAQRWVAEKPKRLIGDLAYDSDPLDQRLRKKHIELISPHKRNRVKESTQDGRALRRYRKRWKVERLFAWLHQFRRLVIRYEKHLVNFKAMLLLGCVMILLRHF